MRSHDPATRDSETSHQRHREPKTLPVPPSNVQTTGDLKPQRFVATGAAAQQHAGCKSLSNEVATHFIPLSYTSAANLQDGGQLVRVELPRSAMVRFGLPVNMERYGERVKADVLVSADGLARAIRFVQ